jgi:hypothetical protein
MDKEILDTLKLILRELERINKNITEVGFVVAECAKSKQQLPRR